jgi:hypothetical protein
MESYLGGAASVQKKGAKPQGRSRRERSQGGPAIGRREEACSFDLAGGSMSPNEGRVSLLRTKPSLLVSRSSRPTTNAVCWLGGKVRPALMPGKGFVSLTDEVPRGSSSNSISCVYIFKMLPGRLEQFTTRSEIPPKHGISNEYASALASHLRMNDAIAGLNHL